ncbi:gamma-glutamylcyclotransferase [Aliidongia dinghuensis]|uniref:glutathione-specific gamma-glutamylcyclotransferase n=1 Tax=Aliidongia dinghuensis TaxID=1867774 RepID=A0A8J3E628_9PROT|nr:gamma-glutamylcyclotransferase [Aliidongia dinghuensis]GGF40204.1 gamma-glutamylcyclotransferase [Aliidongia dinghuensis]
MLWSEHASAPDALPVPEGDLWVFAYGSLMWDPGFPHEAILPAEVEGLTRAFCVRSEGHRGTVAAPGLVVGLLPGGRCRGLAIKADGRHKAATLDYLWRREMALADGYVPRRVIARLDDGRSIEALTFVADLEHAAYAGGLPVEEAARRIATATGQRGTNRDYFERTLAQLVRLGIEDLGLARLGQAIVALA